MQNSDSTTSNCSLISNDNEDIRLLCVWIFILIETWSTIRPNYDLISLEADIKTMQTG